MIFSLLSVNLLKVTVFSAEAIQFKDLSDEPKLVLSSEAANGHFYKKAAFNTFAIFTGKQTVLKSLFNKVADLQVATGAYFIKKRLQHRCFLVNIGKFLRTSILKNNCERLLL